MLSQDASLAWHLADSSELKKSPKFFALGFFVRVNQAISQKLALINTPKYRDQPRAGALFLLPLQGFHRYVLYVSLHHLGEAVR